MESVISASPTGQLGKVKELKVTQLFYVIVCWFFLVVYLFHYCFFPFFANLFQPLV